MTGVYKLPRGAIYKPLFCYTSSFCTVKKSFWSHRATKTGRGEKTPTPKISALVRKRPVLLSGPIPSLLRTENGLNTDIFVVKYTGRGLVVKRPGVLSKVQMLDLVLGVGVFSLLPKRLIRILSSVRERKHLPLTQELKRSETIWFPN